MPSVLALLADGVEEIEFVTPVDLLRRGGVEVVTAAIGTTLDVKGRSGITLRADTLFSQVDPGRFDALFIPGGPGVAHLRADPSVVRTVAAFDREKRAILALCAAPLVLKDAGILAGKRYTAHTSALPELPEAITGVQVVVDGHLVTSRGAGTALPFALAALERLRSKAVSEEVARAICAIEYWVIPLPVRTLIPES